MTQAPEATLNQILFDWVDDVVSQGLTLDTAVERAVARVVTEGRAEEFWLHFGTRVAKDLWWYRQRQERRRVESRTVVVMHEQDEANRTQYALDTTSLEAATFAEPSPGDEPQGSDPTIDEIATPPTTTIVREATVYDRGRLMDPEMVYALVFEINGQRICLGDMTHVHTRAWLAEKRALKNTYIRQEAVVSAINDRAMAHPGQEVRRFFTNDELANLIAGSAL